MAVSASAVQVSKPNSTAETLRAEGWELAEALEPLARWVADREVD